MTNFNFFNCFKKFALDNGSGMDREWTGNGPASDLGMTHPRFDSLSLVSRQSVLAILVACLTLCVGNVWGTTKNGDLFERMSSVDDIVADAEVIFVNQAETYACGTTQNTNNRAAVEVTLNTDGTLTPDEDVQVITLEKDGSNFLFNVGDGYLYAASSSSNQLRTEAEVDASAKAAISISKGDATIEFQGTNSRNYMRYNPNNNNPIFSCYASNSSVATLPQIYRELPAQEVSKGDVDGDGDVDNVDVMLTVSYILGQNPTGFIKAAADMDGNNVVDITDLTILVSMLLRN
jgi:hypothetical protein